MTPALRTRSSRGFTLVEVMLALAILGMALVMLMRSAAGSLYSTAQAQMLGVAVDLARGKMYDLEELLAKEGLGTSDREEQGDFEAEGWPLITWEAKVEQVELPNLDTMKEVGQNAAGDGGQGLASATGAKQPLGAGSGSGSAQDAASQTSGFIEQFYSMISDLLKVGLRKVTLVVKWKVAGRDRDLKVILYVTDAVELVKAADSVMGGLGAGSGSDEGSGSQTVPGQRTSPTPSPGGK
jgi:general secretion pathway protein I